MIKEGSAMLFVGRYHLSLSGLVPVGGRVDTLQLKELREERSRIVRLHYVHPFEAVIWGSGGACIGRLQGGQLEYSYTMKESKSQIMLPFPRTYIISLSICI